MFVVNAKLFLDDLLDTQTCWGNEPKNKKPRNAFSRIGVVLEWNTNLPKDYEKKNVGI